MRATSIYSYLLSFSPPSLPPDYEYPPLNLSRSLQKRGVLNPKVREVHYNDTWLAQITGKLVPAMPWNVEVFRALCGTSIVLVCIPLMWHWKMKNVPAISLTIWILVQNLCYFPNSFIWPDANFRGTFDGGIYCDIQIKLLAAASAGEMAAVAALARNLANIMDENRTVVTETTAMVRRRNMIDIIICVSVPVYMMSAHYIVQPNRYAIASVMGCMAEVDRSWPSIPLLFIWPPIASLVAAYYSSLVLIRLHRHRSTSTSFFSRAGTSTSRFIRLFLLALILIFAHVPLTFWMLKENLSMPRIPYSWHLVHTLEWPYIVKYDYYGRIHPPYWLHSISGIVLFLFFGLGSDAVAMYRRWAVSLHIDTLLPDRLMGRKPAKCPTLDLDGWLDDSGFSRSKSRDEPATSPSYALPARSSPAEKPIESPPSTATFSHHEGSSPRAHDPDELPHLRPDTASTTRLVPSLLPHSVLRSFNFRSSVAADRDLEQQPGPGVTVTTGFNVHVDADGKGPHAL